MIIIRLYSLEHLTTNIAGYNIVGSKPARGSVAVSNKEIKPTN